MNDVQRQYIKRQHRKFHEYIEGVTDGSIIVNKKIKQAVERYKGDIADDRYEFRIDKIDKFLFFLSYIRLNQGNAYVRFQPEGWQLFYFFNLYGFYHAGTDDRKYTTSFLTIARKNGKTTVAVLQALYHLLYDGILDAEVYIVSQTNKLATTGLRIAKNICKNSPALKKRVRRLQYSIKHTTEKTDNVLVATTGDPESLNSIKPAFGILDETHLLTNSELVDMLKSGQVGITNPLMSIISTRGFNTLEYYQYDYENYLSSVLDGTKKDESTFIMMFGLDSEDEIEKSEMWIKSNPNLINPKILTLAQLQDIYEQKRYQLSSLINFVVLNLNFWWESSDTQYIPIEQLEKVFVEALDDELIAGESCYMGFDLSSTKDITSIALIFPPSENHSKFIIKNTNIKTNSIARRVRKGGVDLTKHIESGELIEQKTNIIDYDFLYTMLESMADAYDINIVGYDRFNSSLIVPRLRNDIGLHCVDVPQTTLKLNQGTKFLEKIIYDENVMIDNQVTKWMFKNTKLKFDPQGNVKPDKNKRLDSIDGVMAILNAMTVYIDDIGEEQLHYVASSA